MGSLGKSLALLLVFVFVASLVIIQPATVKASSPKTIVVPDDYSDIQTAINHADNGDTVFVKAGTYRYNEQNSTVVPADRGASYGVIVNKSISLIGDNRNTIIVINWQQGTAVTVYIESDNVNFEGFTVTSDTAPRTWGLGLTGLAISGSNCKITNDIFSKKAVAVSGNNQSITDCTFEDTNSFGISLSLSNSVLVNNTVSGNRNGGIYIDGSNNTIKENNIINNGIQDYGQYPINFDGGGISFDGYSTNIDVCYNNITDNSLYGIQFSRAVSNSSIYNNNITNNGIGINIANLVLSSNYIPGSGTIIFNNNLISNGKNAFVETTFPYKFTEGKIYEPITPGNGTDEVLWDNGLVGNYWSDYNGNGSYVIDSNNVDHHPLTQQVDIASIAVIPTPASAVPELSWLAVIPLFIGVLFVAVKLRHWKVNYD